MGVIQENFQYKRTLLIMFIICDIPDFILINPATGVVCFAKSSLIPKIRTAVANITNRVSLL